VAVLQAPALETFVRVAAGGPSACAIAMDGHIRCWGGSAAINVEVPNDVFVDVAVAGSERVPAEWTESLPAGGRA
jgi:hypothetical protein